MADRPDIPGSAGEAVARLHTAQDRLYANSEWWPELQGPDWWRL